MSEIIEKESVRIEDMIYIVRGQEVMLDFELAYLYKCSNGTKSINLAVKRHINRFPERFMFRLTKEEYYSILRFQDETLELKQGKYSKYLPYAFTEQGVAMLATVLKTSIAEEISIKIMDAFIAMKKIIKYNLIEQKYINNMVLRHDDEIKLLQESFNKMSEGIKNNHLFYDGQVYDAYSLMLDIFDSAKENITIIDNYLDKNLLDILCKTKKEVLVVTNKYNNSDYEKYKMEYSNVKLKIINKFHDRFIIIDNKILYHCGASFKDLGKKCFAINKIEDEEIFEKIINFIN